MGFVAPVVGTVASVVGGKNSKKAAQNTLNDEQNKLNPIIQQLSNWTGIKPEELANLITTIGNAGKSDIATAESQGAYGANQNAVIESELDKNRLNAQASGVQIAANASQQELGALENASGLIQNEYGQQVQVNSINPYAGAGGGISSVISSLTPKPGSATPAVASTPSGLTDTTDGGVNAGGYAAAEQAIGALPAANTQGTSSNWASDFLKPDRG